MHTFFKESKDGSMAPIVELPVFFNALIFLCLGDEKDCCFSDAAGRL
jgi:hypothetical protein